MKNLVRTGLAGLAVVLAGAVLAEGKAGLAEFGVVDQNRDGRVSQAEAQAYSELTSKFATLDADRDSYLSQTEFGKWKATAPGTPPASSFPESGKSPDPAGTSPQSPAEPRSPGASPESAAQAPQSAGESQ